MKFRSFLPAGLAGVVLTFCTATPQAWALVSVSVQPSNPMALVGSNVEFTAQASANAGETITGYRWLMSTNGQPPFVALAGATGPVYTITNAQVTNSGVYIINVSNSYAGNVLAPVSSAPVTLTVQDQARITVQPQGGLVRPTGSSASFSVAALGQALGYQWRLNGTNLVNDGRSSGVDTANLGLASLAVGDSGNYDVVVTNLYGAATSLVAALSVFTPPADATVIVGSPAVFGVTVGGGAPLTFSWLKNGAVLSDGGRVSGASTAALVIANVTTNDVAGYSVTIASSSGSVTSAVATLTVLVPARLTSPGSAPGRQGSAFLYTIAAEGTPPLTLSASALPTGLSFDPLSGVIAGVPIVSGSFPVTIGVKNQFGSDSRTLSLTLTSAVPVITSALTATGREGQGGFNYTIRASGSPFQFGVSGLPLGLALNPTNGVISGTPLYGGTYNLPLSAENAWGVGTTNLVLNLAYATAGGLAITDVANTWSAPYLLDFSFSLRDSTNAAASSAVVRPPSSLQVVCFEGGQPIPSETDFILEKGDQKQLRSFLVLDYTYSLFVIPGAIDAMQDAAKLLINEEPAHALFGIEEFHADYIDPQLVTTNGFTSDKAALSQAIDGIQDTYVQDDYAGTRCWDAMYAALGRFGPTNRDETRYLVVLTDGNDDSSLLNTNRDPVATLVSLAQANQVRIFCVAFGSDINSNALQRLTSQTMGHYYVAATTADLALQYQRIVKDVDGQYLLRWATLKRAPTPFQPSFQVTVDGVTATFNTDPIYQTNSVVTTNTDVNPPALETNLVVTTVLSLPYNPPDWAGDVKAGSLRLLADADLGPETIRLRATYTPRYIRELRLNYRPNYPCTVSLDSAATNELLYGWSLVETNDGTGGKWLTLTSPSPTNLLTSITYGAMGDLLSFHFQYPESVTATQAFSVFMVDNSVYTNMPPSGQSFALENATNFITVYPVPPPHGTPIPWLRAHGFTNNFAAAELSDPNGNGLAVWQDYLAGLDPLDPNSAFAARFQGPPAGWPQVTFDTVATRTYRVETATTLGDWTTLLDNIPGSGGPMTVIDYRDLSSVAAVFYRVVVYSVDLRPDGP